MRCRASRRKCSKLQTPEIVKLSGERFHPVVSASADPADEVAGKVFFISAEELAAADSYEVSDYKRIEVGLKSGAQAWVYVRA